MIGSFLGSFLSALLLGMFCSWEFPWKWDVDGRLVVLFISFLVTFGVLMARFPRPSDVTWF